VAKGDGFGADTERFPVELREAMAARGIVLQPNASENSGLHGAIWRRGPDGVWAWDGAADDRREGVARGE
jgi:gamma-glutamyltranspeptidase/glutathione hydrolase